MQDLIVVGAGGHAKVLLDALSLQGVYRVAGVIGRPDEVENEVLGVRVIGTDADLASLFSDGIECAAVGIGSVGDPTNRMTAVAQLCALGSRWWTRSRRGSGRASGTCRAPRGS